MAAQPNGAHVHDHPPDRSPLVTAWFASWPEVRHELEAVLQAYERRYPSYDRGWVEPVFEMMDITINNLSYRAQWLRANLDHVAGTASADDDDAFYAALAEEMVG
jgi:hypothetical protein